MAYVYVDILDALGPVQSALRAIFGWRSAADYWFPNVRSLGGAILLFGFVLYPYVYLAARAMFQTQGSLFAEAARMLGARPWRLARRITLPLARPAHRGRRLRSRCSRRSTTSAPANISACRR